MTEFRYLNEHFDRNDSSKISDYNRIFENWKRDMYRIRRNLIFDMHWATSSPVIAKNEILFDVRFQGKYLCEIKYKFDPKFVKTFAENVNSSLELFQDVATNFETLIASFDINGGKKSSDYESTFQDWKKLAYTKHAEMAIDVHWQKPNEVIEGNTLFLSIMYRDDCLFEVNYNLFEQSIPVNMEDD